MVKLEVGMYVKTKNGTIFKIIGGNVDHWEIDISYYYLSKCEDDDYNSYAYNKNNSLFEHLIKKASFDIMGLIEVGDYVNGYQVYEVDKECHRITLNGGDIGSEAFRLTYLRPALGKNMGIKSIVTKEQFESMKYVLDKEVK